MESEFRIAIVLMVAAMMPIGVYHRWRAARAGGPVSHAEEGLFFAVVLRLFGLAMWLALLAYLIRPESVRAVALPFPNWLRWCGIVPAGLGPWLMYWTMSHLGNNLTDTVVTRPAATLVTTGPYRWVRHPFYVTAALVMFGITLLSANGAIGGSCLCAIAMLTIRTRKEEAMLVATFGDDYRRYMESTGRFFPRWRHFV